MVNDSAYLLLSKLEKAVPILVPSGANKTLDEEKPDVPDTLSSLKSDESMNPEQVLSLIKVNGTQIGVVVWQPPRDPKGGDNDVASKP